MLGLAAMVLAMTANGNDAVRIGRALPPVIGSMSMLGVPLLSIASSVVLLGETITAPLAIGTALVIAGIAVVILDRPQS